MPTYTSRCAKCSTEHDYFAKIADREKTPTCCEAPTERVLTFAMVPQVGIACGRGEQLRALAAKGIVPASDMQGEAEYRMKAVKEDIKKQKREIVENVILTN